PANSRVLRRLVQRKRTHRAIESPPTGLRPQPDPIDKGIADEALN
ncbi:MAG: hypothetical protein RL109_2045, partial [Pseudomonadota bacterium]